MVVTQGKLKDYRFYCSNPDCEHHSPVDKFDSEAWPEWIDKEVLTAYENPTKSKEIG